MSSQFLRRASLIVGTADNKGLDLSELQFRFTVRRGDLQTPNSLDVRVYNLSDATAKRLLTGNTQSGGTPEFTKISLSAGYQNSEQYGLIFQGQIMQVRRGRESQADTYVDIRAADGDEAYNFAVVNTTLAAGSTLADHIKAICTAMNPYGVTQGYVPPMEAGALPRGKVFFGMARDSMRDTAKNANSSWSIQDGQVQLAPLNAFVPGQITAINSATGMIGWPEQTANGIHIRCLLNPNIKISGVVQVNNASVQDYLLPLDTLTSQIAKELTPRKDWDGYYVVYVADHSGDTRGQQWYTDLICLSADPTAIPQFITNKATVAPPATTQVVNPYG